MSLKIVEVPDIREPIRPCPGFEKKGLAEYKLDLCALCGFGCSYCSSNNGNYLRINRKQFATYAVRQLGKPLKPVDDPELMYVFPNIIERLMTQLASKPQSWGMGKTLMFSMLTDGFSPWLVKQGITKAALDLLLDRSSFRIRILTKNAIIRHDEWLEYFAKHRDRFVIGLSIGTLDNTWAKYVEIGTSSPKARLHALQKLQCAGISTFGMLCPVFPDVLQDNSLELLTSSLQPEYVENIWAEPFNDRMNWQQVRDGYKSGSIGYQWLTDVYELNKKNIWSRYATDLYVRLLNLACQPPYWVSKLRYLLYEDQITEADATRFGDFKGVLLQSKPDNNGFSRNPCIAKIQEHRKKIVHEHQ